METNETCLCNICEKRNTKNKIGQLVGAKGAVIKLSKYGHNGKVGVKAKLVCVHLNPSILQ